MDVFIDRGEKEGSKFLAGTEACIGQMLRKYVRVDSLFEFN